MSFGEKLKELRSSNNLTQGEMCEKLHMEQSNYSKYEKNKSIPSADIITRVMSVFHVSADWLLLSDSNHPEFQESDNNINANAIQTDNYYTVPKEVLDAMLKQQQMLEILLQKVLKKL